MIRLDDLPSGCFEGVIPGLLATASADGMPNATWLSHVHRIDGRHVGLSCQFFRKTRENLAYDPRAQLFLVDPVGFAQWRLELRHVRSESEGPLFEQMANRLKMIAQMTRVEDVFALRSADVFEVMMISAVEVDAAKVAAPSTSTPDPLVALARISEGVAACRTLESIVHSGLELLRMHLALESVSLYLAEASERTLYTLASVGFPASGVGARVPYGQGVIGAVAAQRMAIRVADMDRELLYARNVLEQLALSGKDRERDVPLPGLPDARSLLAVPLVLDGELFGVLATESRRPLAYDERASLTLSTAGQVLAQAIARHRDEEGERDPEPPTPTVARGGEAVKVRYYEADDSVFLDGGYLIKGLPGRILWVMLKAREEEGRELFLNRELRLHPLLKLPSYKDNLETRLLMLQRRLEDKGGALRLGREQRGRVRVHCERRVDLEHVKGAS